MHTAEWGSISSFLKNYYDAPGYAHTVQRTARCPLDEKNGFAQICSLQICRKNVKTQEYIWSKDGKRHKCSIYHICPRFALQFSEICDIFARSKFVQIHFIVNIDFLRFSCFYRLDYQPLFGKMSPHSSPERASFRGGSKTGPGRRRNSSLLRICRRCLFKRSLPRPV